MIFYLHRSHLLQGNTIPLKGVNERNSTMTVFAIIVALLALVAAAGAIWLNVALFQKQKKLKAPEPPDLSGLLKKSEIAGYLVAWKELRAYLHEHYPAIKHLEMYYASKSYVDNHFAKKADVPSRDSIIVDPGAVDHLTLNEHAAALRHLVEAQLADLRSRLQPVEEDIQRLLLEKQAYSEKLDELEETKAAAQTAVDGLRMRQLGEHPTGKEMQEFALRMEQEGRDAHEAWTDYIVNEREKVRQQLRDELESAETDLSAATHAVFQHQHSGDIDRKTKALVALRAQHKGLKEAEKSLVADLETLQPPQDVGDDAIVE
jgi:hypothetical protein